jgi:hypothetical protein
MDSNITQVAMTVYLSFSIIFFTISLFYDWPVWQYLVMFLVFAFIIQFSINMWASAKVCPLGDKNNNVSIEKSLTYTVLPWFLILCVISFILYIMPGWVRVFSNTIGLAVSKSIYYELFTVENPDKFSVNTPLIVGKQTSVVPPPSYDVVKKVLGGAAPGKLEEKSIVAPSKPEVPTKTDTVNISPDVIREIYHDPSKLINEIEYISDFNEWKERIFDKYLKLLPYFANETFFNEKNLYVTMSGGEAGSELPETPGKPKVMPPINPSNNIYKLYKCVATKEKIGYFTWLFLSGAIFTLTSLSQMYSSDC